MRKILFIIFILSALNLFAQPSVELTYFAVEDSKVKWVTTSETNNNYFCIQRSVDGTHWDSIGAIESVGTTTLTTHYEFRDSKQLRKQYYRLKQVCFDGRVELSITLYVKRKGAAIFYPTPTDRYITTEEEGTAIIMSSEGKIFASEFTFLDEPIDVGSYPKGAYYIMYESGDIKIFIIK